jgi:hypothetical protein
LARPSGVEKAGRGRAAFEYACGEKGNPSVNWPGGPRAARSTQELLCAKVPCGCCHAPPRRRPGTPGEASPRNPHGCASVGRDWNFDARQTPTLTSRPSRSRFCPPLELKPPRRPPRPHLARPAGPLRVVRDPPGTGWRDAAIPPAPALASCPPSPHAPDRAPIWPGWPASPSQSTANRTDAAAPPGAAMTAVAYTDFAWAAVAA